MHLLHHLYKSTRLFPFYDSNGGPQYACLNHVSLQHLVYAMESPVVGDFERELTKAISTMFVLVVVGSLLLLSSLEISKTASRSIYKTKGKASESWDPEAAE
jgi:hypothetical protein